MAEYYQQFLSSMSGAGNYPISSPDDIHPPPLSAGPTSMPSGPNSGVYGSGGYFPGFQEPVIVNAPKAPRGRRKSGAGLPPGIDHVKHRRTRSGCFMCRSRRVKCDETRPVCERCRKGNRECVYPDPPTSKGTAGQGSRSKDSAANSQHASPMSSNEDDEDHAPPESKLDPILDEEEPDSSPQYPHIQHGSRNLGIAFSPSHHPFGRRGSETPSQDGNKSSSPSASTVTTGSFTTTPFNASDYAITPGSRVDSSHLPQKMQRHLAWFIENITHYHYCLNYDGEDFFKGVLPAIAITDEALLNALVGFSAYHTTVKNPDGKLEDFLQYYNKSVTLLLASLKRKEKHSATTLLTILQLATIEEYLGDWVNLMGHQKAAFEIITTLFTPQSIAQSPIGRACHYWYSRFDTFIALMGGFPTDLPRDYFCAFASFTQAQVTANPDSIRWKIEERSARLRIINYDMSIVFARGSRGQLSAEQFVIEHGRLTKRLEEWKNTWDPALTDPSHLVQNLPRRQPDPNDIVDPYAPGMIYDSELFNTTMITVEWYSIMLMHKTQSTNVPPQALFAEFVQYSYAISQYFEALEFWPSTPKGVLLNIQACISIAALFLPQDERHQAWLRKKFAIAETQGYIYPLSLRSKMAVHFGDPACVRWWLPNDEGFSPVIQNIRNFADERNAAAVTAQQESLREVRHLFAKLELADEASTEGMAESMKGVKHAN